jgi:hypothetical protein
MTQKRTMTLLPGETLDVPIVYKKIVWNNEMYNEEAVGKVRFEYHKDVSRFIQISTRGHVGFDATANKVSAFQGTSFNWQIMKQLTAYRQNVYGVPSKAYLVNTGAPTFTFAGSSVNEGQVAITGPVYNQVLTVSVTEEG